MLCTRCLRAVFQPREQAFADVKPCFGATNHLTCYPRAISFAIPYDFCRQYMRYDFCPLCTSR
jgi:hypothetical protein